MIYRIRFEMLLYYVNGTIFTPTVDNLYRMSGIELIMKICNQVMLKNLGRLGLIVLQSSISIFSAVFYSLN